MNIVAFLFVGLVAGWISSTLVRGQGLGTIYDIIVGIIGAIVGGFVFDIAGITPSYGLWGALATSVVGATLFLALVSLARGPRKPVKI